MRRLITQAFVGPAACIALLSGYVAGQELVSPEEPKQEQEVVRSEPIDSGYVLLDGRYLPPPYVVEKRGNDLWINDQLAFANWFNWQWGPPDGGEFAGRGWGGGPRGGDRGPGGDPPGGGPPGGGPPDGRQPGESPPDGGAPAVGQPGGGPPEGVRPPGRRGTPPPGGPMRRSMRAWPAPSLAGLEGCLKKDCAIVVGKEFPPCVLSPPEAVALFEILMSDRDSETKLGEIGRELPGYTRMWKWQNVIEEFVPPDELPQRLMAEIERIREVVKDNLRRHEVAIESAFWTSKPVKYVITLLAMGLIVAACGTLLNYRPIGRAAWSEIDATGDGIPIVVRSVVLLILLGVFDLACTLVAQQAGGLTEMNPLGSQIVENPLLLTAFKLTSLLMACGILYALRRYRGAQVAAWWMCLLCTVLTFRWLTYNSMFMT